MFKKPTVTKTVVNLRNLRIYLRSTAKWGKTTLFKNAILEEYGNPEKGLLVGVGNEIGYTLLDELNTTHVDSWKDLIELQKWLIKEKGKEHDIEIVAFDTVDELIPLAEKEVMRMSTMATGKNCDSINKAFNGYGAGQSKLKELVKDYFTTLYKAGFGIFCISHTKVKSIVERGKEDSEGYMILTSNLPNAYEGVFGDIFDCILTGAVDREVSDGVVESTSRRLYFRSTNFIEAGCRFGSDVVPEYMTFDSDAKECAREFVQILKDGLKNSASKPMSDKEFEDKVKKENEKLEMQSKDVAREIEEKENEENQGKVEELIKEIKSKATTSDNKQILVAAMKELGKSKITEFNYKELTEVLGKLK